MTRRRWILLAGGVAVLSFLFLASWTRPGPSSAMCSSCHVAAEAATTASESVHADVPCLACHRRSGILGVVTYVPVLATEIVENVTGWSVIYDDLEARPCESCHGTITESVLLEAGHPGPEADCESCHGDVSHPEGVAAPEGDDVHAQGYDLTHGRDAAFDSAQCTECHQADFCVACHTRGGFPHTDGWIEDHGGVQIEQGDQACVMCHPQSFCSSCHGTEIPHAEDWMEIHYRAVEGSQLAACGTCHPADDCTLCHARHSVHREQSIYEWELAP